MRLLASAVGINPTFGLRLAGFSPLLSESILLLDSDHGLKFHEKKGCVIASYLTYSNLFQFLVELARPSFIERQLLSYL